MGPSEPQAGRPRQRADDGSRSLSRGKHASLYGPKADGDLADRADLAEWLPDRSDGTGPTAACTNVGKIRTASHARRSARWWEALPRRCGG